MVKRKQRRGRGPTKLIAYTDGSSNSQNDSTSGGIGVVFLKGDHLEVKHMLCKNFKFCNAFQAELIACIEAATYWKTTGYTKLIIHCDSKGVIQGINNYRKNVKNLDNKNKNRTLWLELIDLINNNVEFKWVKAHGNSHWNRLADYLARTCREAAENKI